MSSPSISDRIKRRAMRLVEFPLSLIRHSPPPNVKHIIKPPTNALELYDMLDKGVQREMAEKDAENIKLRHEIERIAEDKDRSEHIEIESLAKEHFKKLKTEESMRTLKLEIKGDYPVWFLKNDYVYRDLFLKGFRLYQTAEGYLLWYPWLTDKDGKSFVPVKGAPAFDDLFRSSNIVTQMKGGKFDSNYVHDGYNLYLISDKRMDTGSGKPINIVNLSEQERQEYSNRIEQLTEQYSAVYHELKKQKEKEIGYLRELDEFKLVANTQSKLAESYGGGLSVMAEKTAAMGDALANATTTVQDAKLDQLIAENAVIHLKESIQDLNTQVAYAMKDVDSAISRKVDEKIKDIMGTLDRIQSGQSPQ